MTKPKPAAPVKRVTAIEWTGLRTQRVDYEPGATIFIQGDPATSVMYVEMGAVRLSVLSHAGKEAVIAVLDVGHFFGEGCLASQTQRMATASAMGAASVKVVEKVDMVRHLHARPAFADRFLTHMLTRNIRIEEDLIDQLFNSSGTISAHALAARPVWRTPGLASRASARISGNPRRDDRYDTVTR